MYGFQVGHDLKLALTSLVVTVGGALILRWLQPKARVQWACSHQFHYNVPLTHKDGSVQATPISVATYMVRNAGKAAAENVEVILNYPPEHYEIWPVLKYENHKNPDGRFIISLPTLGASDYFTVNLIGKQPMPVLLRVRCSNGRDGEVPFAPMRVFPRWWNITAFGLLLWGAGSALYWLLQVLSGVNFQ